MEKIDKWQVKKDLEKMGWDIPFKMHYLNDPTPAFSETPEQYSHTLSTIILDTTEF